MKKNNKQTQMDFCEYVLLRLAAGLAEEIKAPLMSLADERCAAAMTCPSHLEIARWEIYLMNTLEKQGKSMKNNTITTKTMDFN